MTRERKILEPVIGENAMIADFTATTKNVQASAYKFTFEVDEQDAQTLLTILGGLPTSGESRPVIIWRPTLQELAQARRERVKPMKQLAAKKTAQIEKNGGDEADE